MDAVIAELRAAGIAVVEEWGWRGHSRPGRHDPVGLMLHWDAGASDRAAVAAARNGRPDLAAPLYQLVVARTGAVHIISGGRTNHAGAGSGVVLAEVRAGIAPAASATARHLPDTESGGNRWWDSLCLANNGRGEVMPGVQVDAAVRTAAAICRARGWSANRVIRHGEWTARKPDPDERNWRGLVAEHLAAGPGGVAVRSEPRAAQLMGDVEDDMMRWTLVEIGPIGADGNGWFSWDPGFGRDPSAPDATLRGLYPPNDGYTPGPLPVLLVQARGGAVIVEVQGARPGAMVPVFVRAW